MAPPSVNSSTSLHTWHITIAFCRWTIIRQLCIWDDDGRFSKTFEEYLVPDNCVPLSDTMIYGYPKRLNTCFNFAIVKADVVDDLHNTFWPFTICIYYYKVHVPQKWTCVVDMYSRPWPTVWYWPRWQLLLLMVLYFNNPVWSGLGLFFCHVSCITNLFLTKQTKLILWE